MRKDIRAQFGERIARMRKRRNLTQQELADLAGLDRTFVGDIEHGDRNPTLLSIERLADALGVHIKTLF